MSQAHRGIVTPKVRTLHNLRGQHFRLRAVKEKK